MAGASDYLENKVLDHLLGRTTYTAPATLYVGLWTAQLDDDATGSTAGEVGVSGYARVSVTNDVTNWPNASNGSKSNAQIINFGQAQSAWGQIRSVALLDANTAGNVLFISQLNPSIYIDAYDPVRFLIGGITVSCN